MSPNVPVRQLGGGKLLAISFEDKLMGDAALFHPKFPSDNGLFAGVWSP